MKVINEKQVLDYGFIKLVDVMGSDEDIANSARVSTGSNNKTDEENKELIKYLMRHRHTSPFEMAVVKFVCKMPIFVARQWVRHRMSSLNEVSGRYSILKTEFYTPDYDRIKGKGKINKQGSENEVESSHKDEWLDKLSQEYISDEKMYNYANDSGISNELARISLPVSTYTEFIWKIDLHNLMHFLKLRMDSHAQFEIQEYARAIYEMVKPLFPYTFDAFEDYILNAVTFSKKELDFLFDAMKSYDVPIYNSDFRIHTWNKLEKIEFFDKIKNYPNPISEF